MRLSALAVLLIACSGLSGCTAGPSVEALQLAEPSPETTSSIARPAATVPGEAAGASAAPPARPAESGMSALAGAPTRGEALDKVAMVAPSDPGAALEEPGGRVYSESFRDAHPIDFGARSPDDYPVHGVDVSRWQGEIDWPKLRRNGANFAYIKATDGIDHRDPMFEENWAAAKRAGIRRGAYHFFYWCRKASEQAEWFIRNVPKEADALPPVLDMEWNHTSKCEWRPSRAEILEKIAVFVNRLERHYGQRPIIYTTPDFYEDNLQGELPNQPFWLRSVAAHPSEVYPGRDWVFWQYSGSGLSHGVEGKIDLNVFRGDRDAWWRWLGTASG